MCGIVGLHLREASLYPQLGSLLTGMLGQMCDRGPDSAGMAIYGDPRLSPAGESTVSILDAPTPANELAAELSARVGVAVGAVDSAPTVVLHGALAAADLVAAVRAVAPTARIIGSGDSVAVLKGVGDPLELAHRFGLPAASGWQGVAHTRMATESAVTAEGSHPFSVGVDQCLVHNGSFSNHLTIKRELERAGTVFDSDNDTEVGARFVARQLAEGADLEKALRLLGERFDGFYTLLVSTAESFAVVRDPIACKPAAIAETPQWVAMASEYRALSGLPGIDDARIFEPEPEEV
ncbi:glutamine amidotransferase [Rhodococcus rhodnii]|uniref:glutamine--fructose-6-phosphate transaminase (isomerizing) n=2 Tax=Rhodococcus rhodnii TaxID=38312 RepID=R7WJ16_9NOCA|nr:glutamine amidotransferase family protein [Rhodococcus rhodnii]EOM75257.1 glutamine amidotransferase-like protein [Rhodococcus rhodnii LMG 5362]TXG92104.1 glutamine amidotransferase [Rhodococcus rhodnii]